jgi:hypothetical protein
MKIVRLTLATKEGRFEVEDVKVIKDYGFIDDVKFSKKNPNIPTLDTASREFITNSNQIGLCYSRFVESITYEGLPFIIDMNISISGTDFLVLKEKKRCFKECDLVKLKKYCPLKENVRYLYPLMDGNIKKGDVINEF